jgi:hypothetical protein
MPHESVPINGVVLAWAMAQAGVDDSELAEWCKTESEVVVAWRLGETQPGKTQFRRIVARLRRPSAIYFLPEPPEDDPVIAAFRQAPGERGERGERAIKNFAQSERRNVFSELLDGYVSMSKQNRQSYRCVAAIAQGSRLKQRAT